MKLARDEILSEIRRVAAQNGGQPPGRGTFESLTGIGATAWHGVHWARWGDALREAGLKPNERFRKSDSDVILQKFCDAARHYGHLPTAAELRMYRRAHLDCPSEKTIQTHFGSKDDLLANLRAWIVDKSAFEDIACMLGPPSLGLPQLAARARRAPEGFVYLIRSGAYYKIGRSDRIEQRMKEIRTTLPEAATLVHAIRTDDPAGIEIYWHRRFKDYRANGEWFRLSRDDVAAFRRRKFQ